MRPLTPLRAWVVFLFVRRSLMNEELAAFAARALVHVTHWAPATAGLHLRSLIEKKFPRQATRALQQLEVPCCRQHGVK